MSVYYSDDRVTLHLGDALDVLPTLTAGTIDHVVTDPPYILQAGSSARRGSKTGGWADMMNASYWYAEWYRQCSRTLKHTSSLWTFGNWRTIPVMMRAAIDSDLAAASLLVWDKDWIGPAGPQQLRSQHEVCLVLTREGFRQPDRSQGDVLRVKVGSYKPTGHPAEKPARLFRRIVELTGCPPGGLVLDPFAGSGTTGVAAKLAGVRSVLIESEERWCEVAARRLSQDVLADEPA